MRNYGNGWPLHSPVLFGGDQLTVAKARGSQQVRMNYNNAVSCLEGLIPIIEDWHATVVLLQVHILICTVFIRIVAVATINFVPFFIRLLIEGGYYTFCARVRVHTHAYAMIATAARACVPYIRTRTYIGHRPPNEFIARAATIRGRLLFFCTRATCGYYSRAATIRCAAIIRKNMVTGD